MKFSTFAVLSLGASASAFVPSVNRAFTRSKPLFALEDLEAKLLAPPTAKSVAEKTKPAPKAKVEKPKPAPKVEKPKPAPKVEKPKPTPTAKVEAPPPPKAVPLPKAASTTKASKKGDAYDFTGVAEKKKAPLTLKAVPRTTPIVTKPKPAKVVAPPKKPVESDPDAGVIGVALGSAPLVLLPLVALSAGRDFLTKTAARRAEIEAEIAAQAAAKAKKARTAEVDAGGLAKAAVSDIGILLSAWP